MSSNTVWLDNKKGAPAERLPLEKTVEISLFAFCFPWAVHLFVPHGRPRSSDRTPSSRPSKDRCEPRDAPSPSASSPAGRSPAASLSWSSSNLHLVVSGPDNSSAPRPGPAERLHILNKYNHFEPVFVDQNVIL